MACSSTPTMLALHASVQQHSREGSRTLHICAASCGCLLAHCSSTGFPAGVKLLVGCGGNLAGDAARARRARHRTRRPAWPPQASTAAPWHAVAHADPAEAVAGAGLHLDTQWRCCEHQEAHAHTHGTFHMRTHHGLSDLHAWPGRTEC